MKKLLPICILLVFGCQNNSNTQVNKDLNALGDSVKKGVQTVNQEARQAIQNIKQDSTLHKIENKLQHVGDTVHH